MFTSLKIVEAGIPWGKSNTAFLMRLELKMSLQRHVGNRGSYVLMLLQTKETLSPSTQIKFLGCFSPQLQKWWGQTNDSGRFCHRWAELWLFTERKSSKQGSALNLHSFKCPAGAIPNVAKMSGCIVIYEKTGLILTSSMSSVNTFQITL